MTTHRLLPILLTAAMVASLPGGRLAGQAGCQAVPAGAWPAPSPGPEWRADVDPAGGHDAAGAVALAPAGPAGRFRRIQTAVDAVAAAVAAGGGTGVVRLLPGRYGFDPADPAINGERWPVLLRPGVSLRGVDALRVILDGAALPPAPSAFPVSSGLGTAPFTPVLLLEAGPGVDFHQVLVSRVSVLDAQVGVLVNGRGDGGVTIAESLFAGCGIGAVVQSRGQPFEGIHRTRFLWCTFGANTIGAAVTATDGAGNPAPPRAAPAIVNCAFKNFIDFEGISCSAILASAFSSVRTNVLQPVLQSHISPVPAVDTESFSTADLFLGARLAPAGQPFSDWRLTHGTLAPSLPNPLRTGGIVAFPASPANGTPVGVQFGSHTVGVESAEGRGTAGPLGPPLGAPGTSHLGYRSGGTLLVGGTAPRTRRFGPAAQGVMYDTIHFVAPGNSSLLLLFGVASSGPAWPSAGGGPAGMLAAPIPMPQSPVPGTILAGEWFLDHSSGLVDMSGLITQSSAGAYEQHIAMPLNLPPWISGQVHMLVQAVAQTGSVFICTDVQAFTIGS